MELADIANRRLRRQQITGTDFTSVKKLVGWLGVVQAQDFAMAKWALGLRLPGATDETIETAIDNTEIIRTHVLRPTWHFVSSDDIYWMLELSAANIKSAFKTRHQELGITTDILTQSIALFEKALQGGNHLTREDLMAGLAKAQIATNENRASHLLGWAEVMGVLCSGVTKNGKRSYALLEEWVPRKKTLTHEEGLAALAQKYFSSHGPATLQDFTWWSGLAVGQARQALDMVKSGFVSETLGPRTYWFADDPLPPGGDSVYLLPAYDEFLISYADRSASLQKEHFNMTVSSNGIFRPVILVNGQVRGLWSRTFKKDTVIIEAQIIEPLDARARDGIEKAASCYAAFLEKKAKINYKP